MTTRVFDCGLHLDRLRDRARDRVDRRRQVRLALFGSLLVVPLAGAADPPAGWLSGALGALAVLFGCGLLRRRIGLGWLALAVCGLALFAPRSTLTLVGPALFVAGGLVCILWFARRLPHDRWRRSGAGGSVRAAQQRMGRSGEQNVRTTLAAELPETFVLLNGLTLPHATGDVDHLVVGPTGVFLIETKMMSGHVECDARGNWRRTRVGRAGTAYGAYIGDPAAQVQRNIWTVRNCLRRRLPHLFWGTPLWIEGLVVFAHPGTELSAKHSTVPALRLADAAARICTHEPLRPLQSQEVVQVTAALLEERQLVLRRAGLHLAQSAQAVFEVAMALPVLLALVFGIVALSRVMQAHSAIVTIAHEVARAGALGSSPEDALQRMAIRTDEVLPGLGLDRATLQVTPDVSGFSRVEGQVAAVARYTVRLSDLPLIGWAPPLELRLAHREFVDPYRAGIRRAAESGP